MKKYISFLFVSLILSISAGAMQIKDLSSSGVIPLPVSVTDEKGSFLLTDKSAIIICDETADLRRIGKYLAERLTPATGFEIPVRLSDSTDLTGNICLGFTKDDQLGQEGYQLKIANGVLNLTANKPNGLFNGIQTIRQLFPAKIEATAPQQGPWEIPAGTIRDYPEYSYRGVMLDVARHFFGVKDIKHIIDLIAAYKINVLHLHLSDDQGWRIEIKKRPKLTEIGGKTQVGGGNGGFYTQEQYTEMVEYAAERYITIVPEIDMPGHTNAALVSYPELNCSENTPELYIGIKVGFSSLCTVKENTYKFISEVLEEIAALTPGPYLHIGGDESNATKLADYIRFENKVQDIVSSLGKQAIGWDEIALSGLKPNSVIQYWAKPQNASKGVGQGAKVIMSPSANAYLDMKYNPASEYGLHWAGYIDVDKGYNWYPETLVPGIKRENILGIEAPLWTETVTNRAELEYMIFPRLPGYAEIGWSKSNSCNWDDYKVRLAKLGERFKVQGINYYPSKLISW